MAQCAAVRRWMSTAAVVGLWSAGSASAQITPAAGYTPPDDTPSIRVGVTLFGDYTYTQSPQTTDADGNAVNASAFNVTRSYINVTGNVSHIVAFRITPDVVRESGLFNSATAATVSNDSLVFRIKYAYLQTNFDDWMTRGSWARLGIQQTPWLDFAEGVYRYRWQGTLFAEREGYFASADAGASFHYNLPSNFGDVHVGVYNGENYNKVEVNDQKAVMIRATVRPFASGAPILRGVRASVFYDGDNYIRDAGRTRFIAAATFEYDYLNASIEYLNTNDRTSAKVGTPDVHGNGLSIWATPKTKTGWQGLLRFDHLTTNTGIEGTRNRTIAGVAYWFPHQGTVSSALMVDYDGQTFDNVTPAQPSLKKIAVHALVNF